jgi:dihydrofolate reductase
MQDGKSRMDVSLIAALDHRFAIGKGNALPWHLPADLKRFKTLTLGKPVLMGRRTAQSLGRALPGRRNLVLTHAATAPFAGMEVVAGIEAALQATGEVEELCVIGGGAVFEETLPIATRLHLTWVDTVVDRADAFFPAFDPARWTIVHRESHAADAQHAMAFEFVDYVR